MEKMAVVAPMPNANVSMDVMVETRGLAQLARGEAAIL
jgi:hypothetical protein